MSSEPSKLSGLKNEIVGVVKENVGKALGNKQMQAEGRLAREQGHTERKAAHNEAKAKGTSTSGKEGIVEKVKEMGNKIIKPTASSSSSSKQFDQDYESRMYGIFASIRGCDYHLKHPQNISDRSAPVLDKSFKLRKPVDRKRLFAEIRKGGWKLRHAETFERKDLHLDQGFKIRKNPRESLFNDITKSSWKLKKVRHPKDRSAPHFDRIKRVKLPAAVLRDLRNSKTYDNLRHVSVQSDRSAPVLDKASFSLKRIDRKPFLGEVKKGYKLKHVETCDKSTLHLPKSFHLTTPIGKTANKPMSSDIKGKGKDRVDMDKSMGRTAAH